MKKTIITVFAVLLLSSSMAFAAPNQGRHGGCDGEGFNERGDQHMTRMFERLDLSDAQMTQIRQLRTELHAEAAPQRDAMHQNMQALREAKRSGDQATIDSLREVVEVQKAEMDKIRESHHEQIAQILTPEQREQFEAIRSQRQGGHGRHGGKGRGHGHGHGHGQGNGNGRF